MAAELEIKAFYFSLENPWPASHRGPIAARLAGEWLAGGWLARWVLAAWLANLAGW